MLLIQTLIYLSKKEEIGHLFMWHPAEKNGLTVSFDFFCFFFMSALLFLQALYNAKRGSTDLRFSACKQSVSSFWSLFLMAFFLSNGCRYLLNLLAMRSSSAFIDDSLLSYLCYAFNSISLLFILTQRVPT